MFFAAFLLVLVGITFNIGVSHAWAQEDSSSTDSSITDTSNSETSDSDSNNSQVTPPDTSDSGDANTYDTPSDTSGTDTQSDASSSPSFNWWPFGNHSTSSDATTTSGWNLFGFHFGGHGSTDASSSDATTTGHAWWDLGGLFATSSTGDTGSTTPTFDFNDFLKNKLGFGRNHNATSTASTTDTTTIIPHHPLPTHQTKTHDQHQNNASGKIISINGSSIVVNETLHGRTSINVSVDTASGVRIRDGHDSDKVSDLKVGMIVSVIGRAESDGNIQARMIVVTRDH